MNIRKLQPMCNIIKTAAVILSLAGLFASTNASAGAWEDITLKGDFRYRHEMTEVENVDDDRHRQRIRGRLGLWGKVNDEVKFGLRLATGGNGVTSTNQTLEGSASNKNVGWDLYYITWQAMEELELTIGKMKNPFFIPAKNPLLWDSDVTPEGIAMNYGRNMGDVALFFNLAGLFIEENNPGREQGLLGAQLGAGIPLGEHKITVGVSHNAFANIAGSTPNTGLLGNSSNDATTYANDFKVTEFFVEYKGMLAELPFKVGGSFFSNSEASVNDKGHWAAVIVGDVKKKGWSAKFANFKTEADATLGAFHDSDVFGGGTDGEGNLIGASYGLGKNAQTNFTYVISETGISGTATERKLAQLDFVFKF